MFVLKGKIYKGEAPLTFLGSAIAVDDPGQIRDRRVEPHMG